MKIPLVLSFSAFIGMALRALWIHCLRQESPSAPAIGLSRVSSGKNLVPETREMALNQRHETMRHSRSSPYCPEFGSRVPISCLGWTPPLQIQACLEYSTGYGLSGVPHLLVTGLTIVSTKRDLRPETRDQGKDMEPGTGVPLLLWTDRDL